MTEVHGGLVRYEELDPFKVEAQNAGLRTARNLRDLGIEEVASSRGESCHLIRFPDGSYHAHVEETLGTKNIASQIVYETTGSVDVFAHVAIDAARMILNDLCTSGARALTLAMHFAVGDSAWFNDHARAKAILRGWEEACQKARCIFAGGETPALKGLVTGGQFVISGSATGLIPTEQRRIKGNIEAGCRILIVASSGIHANGLTDARSVAQRLPQDYDTPLGDGRTYGQAILTPTADYTQLVQALLDHGIDLRYAINLTGHGWRKLMRAVDPFIYTITELPPVPEELTLIGQTLCYGIDRMYETFNMGAGFALIVPESEVSTAMLIARQSGHVVWNAGVVSQDGDAKRVDIVPINVTYAGESLAIR